MIIGSTKGKTVMRHSVHAYAMQRLFPGLWQLSSRFLMMEVRPIIHVLYIHEINNCSLLILYIDLYTLKIIYD